MANVPVKLKRYLSPSTWDDLYVASDYSTLLNKPSTFTPTAHAHGNISDAGNITTAVTPASGDYLLLSDASNSGKIVRGPLLATADGTFLKNDGTFGAPSVAFANITAKPTTLSGFGITDGALYTYNSGNPLIGDASNYIKIEYSGRSRLYVKHGGGTEVELADVAHVHETFDRATSALTGANVFSDIVVTDGIVSGISSRALTASDVGAAASAHLHTGTYEPIITKGTTSQYFRGDMSLATMPTSLPASDVYAWAKASTKPAYTYSEVGAAASSHTHAYAPTSHATNGSTYGYGDTTNAGHLRVGTGLGVATGTVSLSKLGSLVTISTNTTLALATHANKSVQVTAIATITIPTNASVAFPIGTEIDFIRITSSDVTFSPASGVTLYSEASKRKINAQYQAVTLKKINTDVWVLIGALKS